MASEDPVNYRKDREEYAYPIIREITLLTNLVTIPTVKAAAEALQNADKAAWNRLFTPKAVL